MNYLIPSTLLIAMIVISYKMYKEYVKRRRAESVKAKRDEETRFIIKRKVMRDIKERAKYWDNFNVELYVNYLESK